MLIAAVLCFGVAVAIGVASVRLLARPDAGDPLRQALRAVVPTQLAAAVMLTAGGVVALSERHGTGAVVLIVCVAGALATVAAGCWQSAKVVARDRANQAAPVECGGACASCRLSCH